MSHRTSFWGSCVEFFAEQLCGGTSHPTRRPRGVNLSDIGKRERKRELFERSLTLLSSPPPPYVAPPPFFPPSTRPCPCFNECKFLLFFFLSSSCFSCFLEFEPFRVIFVNKNLNVEYPFTFLSLETLKNQISLEKGLRKRRMKRRNIYNARLRR